MEIIYYKDTHIIRAWNADSETPKLLKPRSDNEVRVVWDVEIPSVKSDYYLVDLKSKQVIPNPDYTPTRVATTNIADIESRVAKLEAQI